jgi:hypothetical protein
MALLEVLDPAYAKLKLDSLDSSLSSLKAALSSVGTDKLRVSVVDSLPLSPVNLAQVSGTALTARDWSADFAKLQNIDVALSTRASESTLSSFSGKFPSAAALSDSLSNPTTTIVGCANLGWDGTYWRRVAVDSSARLRVVAESVANPPNLDISLTSLRQALYAVSRYASELYDVYDTATVSTTATSWTAVKGYFFYPRLWPKKVYAYYVVAGIRGYIDTSGQTLYLRIRSLRTGATSSTYSITSTSDVWVYPSMTVYGVFSEWENIYVDAYVTGGTGYITSVWLYVHPLEVPYAVKGTGAGFQATPLLADANNAARVSDYYVYNPGNAETFTTTPLGASATYYGPTRDFLYSRLTTFGVMGYADQPSASNGVYVQLSLDGSNWDYQGATTTLPAAGAVSLAQVVTARYARVVWVNGSTAQTAFRLGGRYMISGSENPPLSYAPPLYIEAVCVACGRDMTETGDFFVEDNKVYCPKCYANKRWREVRDRGEWVRSLRAWLKTAGEGERARAKDHAPDGFLEVAG